MILKPKSREEWLEMRQSQGIGGSESGVVLGLNRYKSNIELWKEKTGLKQAEDISDKSAVKFGKAAEQYIRELFKLENPQYNVDYHEFYMYINDKSPFIFATLDGEITDENGNRGILEIKTTEIKNSSQWEEWDGKIPDSYYAQILHQLAATGWDFAELVAYIRYYKGSEKRVTIRRYRIDRKDVESDIEYLIRQEKIFWEKVLRKERPALILPEI